MRHMATKFLPPAKEEVYRTCEKTKCENKQGFMETTVLLITALVGVGGACRCFSFLFLLFFHIIKRSFCTRLQRKYLTNAPHAHETLPAEQLIVIEKKPPWYNLINASKAVQLEEVSSMCVGIHKMADRRHLQRDDGHGEESETGTAAAALKNASLSTCKKKKKPPALRFPPISSLPARLMGQSLQLTHWR